MTPRAATGSPRPRVAALIPTLGGDAARLRRAIDAVRAQRDDVELEVLCIVNRAGAAPEEVAELAELGARVVSAGLNLGWAGGLAFARRLVDADLLWLVQDDMVPAPTCLAELRRALEADDRLALVSPLVVTEDGMVPPHSCGASIDDTGALTDLIPAEPIAAGDFRPETWGDYVPSRGMLIRRDDWDAAGGMDPRYYPVLWADADLCAALSARGRRFAIATDAECRHQINGSLPGGLGPILHARNRELFLAKWRTASAGRGVADPLRPTSVRDLDGVVDERVDRELIDVVAQSAGDALLHVSRHLIAEVRAERFRADRAEQDAAELRASWSWRLTAPLRALARVAARDRR